MSNTGKGQLSVGLYLHGGAFANLLLVTYTELPEAEQMAIGIDFLPAFYAIVVRIFVLKFKVFLEQEIGGYATVQEESVTVIAIKVVAEQQWYFNNLAAGLNTLGDNAGFPEAFFGGVVLPFGTVGDVSVVSSDLGSEFLAEAIFGFEPEAVLSLTEVLVAASTVHAAEAGGNNQATGTFTLRLIHFLLPGLRFR